LHDRAQLPNYEHPVGDKHLRSNILLATLVTTTTTTSARRNRRRLLL
jgi:hypothetical protein